MAPTGMKKAAKAKQRKNKSSNQGEGARKLFARAELELVNNGEKIAAEITRKALGGDATCARLLLDLSEQAKDNEEMINPATAASLALIWRNEPEWRGETSEADAETGAGSREPEW